MVDPGLVGQMGEPPFSLLINLLFLFLLPWIRLCSLPYPPPLPDVLLYSGFSGLGPHFPPATQAFSGLPGVPDGYDPWVFPTFLAPPQDQLMEPAGTYPLWPLDRLDW